MEAGKRAGLLSRIGIEIGGTKLLLVRADGAGGITRRLRLGIDAARGGEGIRKQIEAALPELIGSSTIESVGVGFGGPVNWRTGRICLSHQIPGWSEFDLAEWLGRLIGAPVVVDNDANVAALGEARHGAGKDFNPVFYVTLGSGVGGGLVVDRALYHGAGPGEAELGHVRLDRNGTTLESRCSGWAIDGRIRALKGRSPLLDRLTARMSGGEAAVLGEALTQGDAVARQLLQELSDDLAFGFSHVVHLFHPEVIVIGGGLSGLGEPLRAAVEDKLRPLTMKAFAPGARICLSALGEDAVPVGALELAGEYQTILRTPSANLKTGPATLIGSFVKRETPGLDGETSRK